MIVRACGLNGVKACRPSFTVTSQMPVSVSQCGDLTCL